MPDGGFRCRPAFDPNMDGAVADGEQLHASAAAAQRGLLKRAAHARFEIDGMQIVQQKDGARGRVDGELLDEGAARPRTQDTISIMRSRPAP